MKRSSQRILTTHVGSLPRPKALWELIDAKDKNQAYDESALGTQLKSAVTAVVRKEVEAGIDIPSDGEQSHCCPAIVWARPITSGDSLV